MNIKEYIEHEKERYERFAETIAVIIQSALSRQPKLAQPLFVKPRAKAESSLKIKLESRGLLASDKIEAEIKDIAGCRVVFYTNGNADAFLQSGIIFNQFCVEKDETKVHHPVPDEPNADLQYRAIHYIVSLTKERLSLPEYASYAGLRCEVQIQTLLNHAWSETAHNIIYKNSLQQGFGKRELEDIKKRLDGIMTKYLVPAGHEFEKVRNDAVILEIGNDFLKSDPIARLNKASDNNDRFELLTSLKKYVLPYVDDVRTLLPALLQVIPNIIATARVTEPKDINTDIGTFSGRSSYDVTKAAIDVVDYLRYVNIEASLSIYCEAFEKADKREKERILKAVRDLAQYNLLIFQHAGPAVQSKLLNALGKYEPEKRNLLREIFRCVCKKSLESEISGTSSPAYNVFAFQRGSVVVSPLLEQVRSEALSLLEVLFLEANTEEDKRITIDAMLSATRQPSMADYDENILALIIENTCRIVEFCVRHVSDMSYELKQHIEHKFLWYYQHMPSWAKKDDTKMQDSINKLQGGIKSFRDKINGNEEYVLYKTLVGFEFVFAKDWEKTNYDIGGSRNYRLEEIEKYVDGAWSAADSAKWLGIIKRCLQTRSNDGATFEVFGEFLKMLSTRQPDVMFSYLGAIPEELSRFMPSIFVGLERSEKAEDAKAFVERWIAGGILMLTILRGIFAWQKRAILTS